MNFKFNVANKPQSKVGDLKAGDTFIFASIAGAAVWMVLDDKSEDVRRRVRLPSGVPVVSLNDGSIYVCRSDYHCVPVTVNSTVEIA